MLRPDEKIVVCTLLYGLSADEIAVDLHRSKLDV